MTSPHPANLPTNPSAVPAPLADQVADALGDRENIAKYQYLCDRYPKGAIEQALAETQAVPKSKIRHSRFSLFRFLVMKHAEETK